MKKLFLKQMFITNKIKTLLIVAFAIFSSNIFGQEYLIKESSLKMRDLRAKESKEFARIQSNEMYTDHYLVEMGSLAKTQSKDAVSILIPQSDCGTLTFRAKSVEYNSEKDYSWHGTLDSTLKEPVCGCVTGSLTLVSSKYGKIGHIMVGELVYELLQIGDDRFLLGKLDSSSKVFSKKECAVSHKAPINNTTIKSPKKAQKGQSTCCTVRCIVFYTPAALALEGSVAAINNRVNLAITQTNTALANSDIGSCDLTIELTSVNPYFLPTATGAENPDDIFGDVTAMANDSNPGGAQNFRDGDDADIVVLLTGDVYNDFAGAVVPLDHPNRDNAYAIVEAGSATTGRFTFAHEVAHLFGGLHDEAHDFKTGAFLCFGGTTRRTILRVMAAGQVRIQHYSNPDVDFEGKRTGKNNRNNADIILTNACTVAEFRDTVEPFTVTISGADSGCPCEDLHQYVNFTSGGTPGATFNYSWFVSSDETNWTSLAGASSSIYVAMPCIAGDGIFLRVDVSDNFGNTDSFTRYLEAEYLSGDVCIFRMGKVNSETILSVSPNPTNGQSVVSIKVDKESAYTISIKDINGRVLSTVADGDILRIGTHNFPLNITNSKNSLFYIHSVDTDGNQIVEKLLKL